MADANQKRWVLSTSLQLRTLSLAAGAWQKVQKFKGHIYDCSDDYQADIFVKMTKEIAKHVSNNYKYTGNINCTIEQLKHPTIAEPN